MDAGEEADHAGRDERRDSGEGRIGHLRRLDEIVTEGGGEQLTHLSYSKQVRLKTGTKCSSNHCA